MVVNHLKNFILLEDHQQATQYNTFNEDIYNIVERCSTNYRGMVDLLSMLHKQRIILNGRTIVIIGVFPD